MKLYLIFIVFLLSSLHSYEAQGVNRKLMTNKSASSTTISKIHKNEENRNPPKSGVKSANAPVAYKDDFMFNAFSKSFEHEQDVANEPYPNDIDVVDYTHARNNPPIHN
ncbi:hypothetical protein QVD17_29733 [Tagetes erecta]|uniref:Uncharacterized protein n=1 Tax=Tagetes erecta TaxID=13708 RepID=A0AAD8K427_TARER|nr:hypothetical protein QVD17_29733 [Tagetes erecta]